MNISGAQFGLFGSVSLFAGVPFVLIGGWITDRIGNRIAMAMFCGFVCLGASIIAIAGSLSSYNLMLFGCFVFG